MPRIHLTRAALSVAILTQAFVAVDAQTRPASPTIDDVVHLVESKVATARILGRIGSPCDLTITADAEQKLARAGADSALMAELKRSCKTEAPPPPAPPPPSSSPAATSRPAAVAQAGAAKSPEAQMLRTLRVAFSGCRVDGASTTCRLSLTETQSSKQYRVVAVQPLNALLEPVGMSDVRMAVATDSTGIFTLREGQTIPIVAVLRDLPAGTDRITIRASIDEPGAGLGFIVFDEIALVRNPN